MAEQFSLSPHNFSRRHLASKSLGTKHNASLAGHNFFETRLVRIADSVVSSLSPIR